MSSKEDNFRKIYALAKDLHGLAPWKWMFESDVFGVRIPETGSIYFISIMGSREEFFAVSAYRDVRALAQFWQFQEGDDDPEPVTFLTIPQIMLSFTDRENLSPGQLASIKSAGIPFRGKGRWPSLEEIVPAYLPVLPEGRSLSDAVIILEQTLDVARRSEDNPALVSPEDMGEEVYLVRERTGERPSGPWKDHYLELDPDLAGVTYQLIFLEESALKVSRLPESRKIVQLDLVMLPTPVKEKGSKGYFPFALLFLDEKTGLVLGVDTLAPKPDLDTMYETLPQRVLDKLLELGFLPQRIEVRSSLLAGLLKPVLDTANVRLLPVRTLEAMDEAVLSLIEHLGPTGN